MRIELILKFGVCALFFFYFFPSSNDHVTMNPKVIDINKINLWTKMQETLFELHNILQLINWFIDSMFRMWVSLRICQHLGKYISWHFSINESNLIESDSCTNEVFLQFSSGAMILAFYFKKYEYLLSCRYYFITDDDTFPGNHYILQISRKINSPFGCGP